MKKTLAAIAVGFTLIVGATSASAIQIYNGTSTPSKTPDQQGWLYLNGTFPPISPPPTPTPSQTATNNGTVLNSGNSSYYAGYFYNYPRVNVTLDRTQGYSITFSAKLNSESHNNNNRGGFSVIVISNTVSGEAQPYGVEFDFRKETDSLGKDQYKIWAQDSTFTTPNPAESATLDTQPDSYILFVQGDTYQLFKSGSVSPLFTGKLKTYNFTPPAGYPNPYTTPNLIFFGDNTTSATANVTIKNVYATPLSESKGTSGGSGSANSTGGSGGGNSTGGSGSANSTGGSGSGNSTGGSGSGNSTGGSGSGNSTSSK